MKVQIAFFTDFYICRLSLDSKYCRRLGLFEELVVRDFYICENDRRI